jgi:hypothetical protein
MTERRIRYHKMSTSRTAKRARSEMRKLYQSLNQKMREDFPIEERWFFERVIAFLDRTDRSSLAATSKNARAACLDIGMETRSREPRTTPHDRNRFVGCREAESTIRFVDINAESCDAISAVDAWMGVSRDSIKANPWSNDPLDKMHQAIHLCHSNDAMPRKSEEDVDYISFIESSRRTLSACGADQLARAMVTRTIDQLADVDRVFIFDFAPSGDATDLPAIFYTLNSHEDLGSVAVAKAKQVEVMDYDGVITTERPLEIVRDARRYIISPYGRVLWSDAPGATLPSLVGIVPPSSHFAEPDGPLYYTGSVAVYPTEWTVARKSTTTTTTTEEERGESLSIVLDPFAGKTPVSVHVRNPRISR